MQALWADIPPINSRAKERLGYPTQKPETLLERIVVQVKSGHVNRGMVATLKGDMEREDAVIGICATLEAPSEPMRQEAIAAGFYEPESLPGNQLPKVQILTIEELLSGTQPDYPRFAAPQASRRRAAVARSLNPTHADTRLRRHRASRGGGRNEVRSESGRVTGTVLRTFVRQVRYGRS